jgi:hypothetical protein
MGCFLGWASAQDELARRFSLGRRLMLSFFFFWIFQCIIQMMIILSALCFALSYTEKQLSKI